MRLIQFGDVALPAYNAEDSIGVTIRNNVITLPYGAFDADGSDGVLVPNTFSRRGLIISSLDATMDALAAEAAKGSRMLQARMRDDSIRYTYAKVTQLIREADVGRYNCEQPYIIQFQQVYPYWLGDLVNGAVAMDELPEDFFIGNSGNVRAPRGTITFAPQNASHITWPRITNSTNGMFIEYQGYVGQLDVLTIDLLTKTAILEDDGVEEDAYKDIVTSDDFLDWMILETGLNTIQITGLSIGGTVDFNWQYNHHYV